MKENKIVHGPRRGLAIALTVLAAIVIVALAFAYEKLHALYVEQCEIRNFSEQVSIVSGKMVKPDVLAESLGLRPGANLALIDFDQRREEALRKIPTLKSLSVTRILPDRLQIVAEERVPIARMGFTNRKRTTGKVVDSEGMVFICQRGTQMLPLIREPSPPGTAVGQKLNGRARAALQLVDTCREAEFLELGLLEVDVSKLDFLVATLNDYSKVKIVWEGMDDSHIRGRDDLRLRLTHLLQAIHSNVGAGAATWNVTVPGKVFADTQGKL